MISKEQNEFLTRTGPGTPMGDLFRRYWMPALMSSELPEPDCPPMRLSLLSEKLIAFRDTDGKVGIMDEFCPHRGVSLWFGRNEEHGLRCPYHGWKFNTAGECVEVPSEGADFCKRVKFTSYPAIEKAGVIWAYMGPAELVPELPSFEWMDLPADHIYVSKRWQECNFLQAMEGGIDSSHVSFLHKGDLGRDPLRKGAAGAKYALNTKTVFEVEESTGGLMICARRVADEGFYYWRLSQWMMPYYTLIPPYKGNALNGHAWVPKDDENCIAWNFTYHSERPLTVEEREHMDNGHGIHPELIKDGSFRPVGNRDNDYMMDRAAQKSGLSFSGIKGIGLQDSAVQESMGRISDRTREHLVSTDRAIVMARARLRKAALESREGGTPPALDAAGQRVRSASFVLPIGEPFRETALDAQQVRLGEPFVAV